MSSVWNRMFDPDASPGRAPPLPKDVPVNYKMTYNKDLVRYIPVDPERLWEITGEFWPYYPKDRDQIRKRIADRKKALGKAIVWGPHPKPRSNSPHTKYLKNAEAARQEATPPRAKTRSRAKTLESTRRSRSTRRAKPHSV